MADFKLVIDDQSAVASFNVLGVQGPPGAAGQGVPVGGTTGQALVKASDSDFDTAWTSVSGVGGDATNLGYTAAPTNGTVTSDTGTDAIIPLVGGVNAGLMSSASLAALNTAIQPGDLAMVATTGAYADLTGIPATFTPSPHTHTLSQITDAGTAAAAATGDFATAAQGALAGTALQPLDNVSALTNDAGYTANAGTVTSVALTAGAGITVTGGPVTGSGAITVANAAPDQVVDLTAGANITVTGVYPNFSISAVVPTGALADLDTVGTPQIDNSAVTIPKIGATGTPSSSTFLRGDGAWASPAGDGGGDLLAANNLSDLASIPTARSNLGLAIGTDVQAYSAVLAATTASYTIAEASKLSGIEAGADVTDTANVTAAGALMDSEVTNLAAVKAFAPADYATAAQGSLADTAVQPAGIADFETTTELNARDTANRSRPNHTGTQTASTISDFSTAADARIAASNKVSSDPTGVTGADAITNMVSLTQAEYDAIGTPDTATLYVIV